jgi:glutaredoxin
MAGFENTNQADFCRVSLSTSLKSHTQAGDYRKYLDAKPFPITLYGTATCQYCELTRKYLISAGVPFNDLRVDKNIEFEADLKTLGVDGVPVLLAENRILTGYYPKEIDELVKSTGTR